MRKGRDSGAMVVRVRKDRETPRAAPRSPYPRQRRRPPTSLLRREIPWKGFLIAAGITLVIATLVFSLWKHKKTVDRAEYERQYSEAAINHTGPPE